MKIPNVFPDFKKKKRHCRSVLKSKKLLNEKLYTLAATFEEIHSFFGTENINIGYF